MPKKNRESGKQTRVKVGNISDISGTVNVAGGNINTSQAVNRLSTAEIRQLFDRLYAKIEKRPKTLSAGKEVLRTEVKEIESAIMEAAQKNERVNESFLSRRFRNIARVAPDL